MSSQRTPVRSGRSAPVVAVTAAGTPVGAAVLRGLGRRAGRPDGPAAVVAVDAETAAQSDQDAVTRRPADCAGPQVETALAGAQVVVHVANSGDLAGDLRLPDAVRRARAVRTVQRVATGCAQAGVGRLVVISSAMVYGARAGNPVPLPDDAPIGATADDGVLGDLLAVERIVARLPRVHPQLRTTVLRPATLVGPGVDTLVGRNLAAPRLLALRGEQMLWQFCHVDDLAGAVVRVVADGGLDGVLSVASSGWLTGAEVAQQRGMRRVELPAALAYATAARLHRIGLTATPVTDLTFLVSPWVVGAQRLLAAGWQPEHDAPGCLEALPPPAGADEEEPPVGPTPRGRERNDAVLGTVGAAVAILGTAAVLRQARARRTGRRRPSL